MVRTESIFMNKVYFFTFDPDTETNYTSKTRAVLSTICIYWQGCTEIGNGTVQ